MRLLGEIVRLQVQTTSLKVGERPKRRYDPAGLAAVPALGLTDGGVWGYTESGERLGDVHHRDHSASKHKGENPISICFTGHYAAMRDRFGAHMTDGIAGENILVACAGMIVESDLGGGVEIETRDGRRIALHHVIVAAPCGEFSRFSLRVPDDARQDGTLTEAVRFLNHGMRGFYAIHSGPEERIALGDRIFAR